MFKTILLIGTGSFIGGVSRYLLSRLINVNITSNFPWATLSINILGCLCIGLLYGLCERSSFMTNELRFFLIVGLCGGFTTFSTFAYEGLSLLTNHNFLHFSCYATASLLLGLFAVYAGHLVVRVF